MELNIPRRDEINVMTVANDHVDLSTVKVYKYSRSYITAPARPAVIKPYQ